MRHPNSYISTIVFTWLLALSCLANATPVYLHLESRFPSGNQPRAWLDANTKRVQFQRWFRVQTRDKAYGWIAEDHLLTSLRLTDQAIVTEAVPARSQPELDAILGKDEIKKSTRVILLEIKGSWARVQPLPAAESSAAWVQTESLLPAPFDPIGNRAFVHTKTPLFILPGMHARNLGDLNEETYLQILDAGPKGWIEVQHGLQRGFVRENDVWTLKDLKDQGVRPLLSLTPLRSAPLPYADLIRTLQPSTTLKVIAAKTLRWGEVKTPDVGLLWWPMSEDFADHDAPIKSKDVSLKIQTVELFSRKVFDMAASQAVPSLKFVSAQGIYRTLDGDEWTKIPMFEDHNYPIAIAPGGPVFIGPFVSDDQGETFEQWIRWDQLVATLGTRLDISSKKMRLLEVKPLDPTGRKLAIKLGLGNSLSAKLMTDDQGLSWYSVP